MKQLLSFFDHRYVVIVGNYGSGKTELALNLALAAAREGTATLVDLDIVNPYFRSGEKAEELRRAGVRVLMPSFALSTVDIPALPAEIQSVFETPCDRVIFDVGGDDTGAAALGRYAPSFARFRMDAQMVLVVNCMRPLTQTAEDIAELAQRIEARSRLNLDAMVNNTNLAGQTNAAMVEAGEAIVRKAAEALGVKRVATTALAEVAAGCQVEHSLMITRYMAPEWMDEQ